MSLKGPTVLVTPRGGVFLTQPPASFYLRIQEVLRGVLMCGAGSPGRERCELPSFQPPAKGGGHGGHQTG